MPVEFGQVDRTLRGLTFGRVRGGNARQAQRELEGLQEYELQYKIAIAGTAEEVVAWSEVPLRFDVEFVDAAAQREAPFDRPHFTYGAYIESGGPVGIHACVTRWTMGKRNEVIGCIIAIGPVATDQSRRFRGELHARFQGYGAPAESYGDPTMYDVD
jgi:hypothetical protein